jgi:hypothetical protein
MRLDTGSHRRDASQIATLSRGKPMNKVVARIADGRTVKGFTTDFSPDKAHFHVNPAELAPDARAVDLGVADLKALYFVKDFAGDPQHHDDMRFDPSRRALGRKIRVIFKDGEEMTGTTQGYQPGRSGFFLVPADPGSNIERCYVVAGATKHIELM